MKKYLTQLWGSTKKFLNTFGRVLLLPFRLAFKHWLKKPIEPIVPKPSSAHRRALYKYAFKMAIRRFMGQHVDAGVDIRDGALTYRLHTKLERRLARKKLHKLHGSPEPRWW